MRGAATVSSQRDERPAVMVGTLTNDKKAAREVVMPVDWILSSVAVIGVLAFVAVLLFVDFKPRSL